MYFGENLKTLMKKHKKSGDELGKLLGKSKSAVSTYVSGSVSPSISDLAIIRNLFKVDLDTLFFKKIESIDNVESINKVDFIGQTIQKVENTEGVIENLQRRVTALENEVIKLKQLLDKF